MTEKSSLSIVKLETKMEYIEWQLDKIEKDVKHNFVTLENKLDSFIESADKKYASKDYEYAIKWLIWIVIAWVVTAVLALVLR